MNTEGYQALFLEEGREHLAHLMRLTAVAESTPQLSSIQHVDALFRHLHTLKGLAAAMHQTPMVALAHRLEDVVGLGRTLGHLSAEQLALVHLGGRLLQQMLEDSGAGALSPCELAPLMARLQAVLPATPACPPAAAAPAVAVGIVAAARARLTVDLAPACTSPGLRAFLVLRRIAEVAELADAVPSLADIRAGRVQPTQLRIDLRSHPDLQQLRRRLLQIPDVQAVVAESLTPAAPPALSPSEPADSGSQLPRLRVSTARLDSMLEQVSGLILERQRLQQLLVSQCPELAEVRERLGGLGQRLRSLHDTLMGARLMPVSSLLSRYPDLLQALAQTLNKQAALRLPEQDLELDRGILEALDAPLVQLIRNALDHGIEAPDVRLAAGKPAAGQVQLRLERVQDVLQICVQDDGQGLDPQQLMQVAAARGLLSPAQLTRLSPAEQLQLICLPGFSTRDRISAISGRGVGMDVVAAGLAQLGGSLRIESALGRGTQIWLDVPTQLSLVPAMLLSAAGQVFAVPLMRLRAICSTAGKMHSEEAERWGLDYGAHRLPLWRLDALLGCKTESDLSALPLALILDAGPYMFALAVDALMGQQDVVIKALGAPLNRLEWFSGATLLSDGTPALILDIPPWLRQWAQGRQQPALPTSEP